MSPQAASPESLRAFTLASGQPISEDRSNSVSNWLGATLPAANQRWPEIALAEEAFARDLGARVAASNFDLKSEPKLHAVDLFLACACVAKVPPAAPAFDREHLQRIGPLLRHIDASTPFAEEVRQCLRDKLLV